METDSADELRKRMLVVRQQMHADVQELVRNARIKTDWRHYIEKYPWLSLGAAAMLGFWLVPVAARKLVLDPKLLAKLAPDQVPVSLSRGKSVFGLVAGTVVPLVTRAAMNKLMAHLLQEEQRTEPRPEARSAEDVGRYPKPR